MKFEQLLQIYWSRGFLYGGKLRNFNLTLKEFFNEMPGMSSFSKRIFVKRFELNYLNFNKNEDLLILNLEQRKIINMYLSQIISINFDTDQLLKYNLIRLYLIKTFRGRCHALGKPSRGQRTWSNASTAFQLNRTIRHFISQVKKNNIIEKKKESLNSKLIKKKVRNAAPKIKMLIVKKKKNIWF